MRASCYEPAFVGKDDEIQGLYFAYDHCAEHEWGIKTLQRLFGMPQRDEQPELWGIERRIPTQIPDFLFWHKWKDGSEGFLCYQVWPEARKDEILEHFVNGELRFRYKGSTRKLRKDGKPYKNPRMTETIYGTMATAWDEGSFAVRSSDPEEIEALRKVYDALREKKACLQLGGPDSNNPFGGSGLCILFVSAIDDKMREESRKADQDRFAIKAWVKESGIEKELAAAGKKYFALSPRRNDEGNIVFWLNPMSQNEYNACWCTLEDLRAWTKNEGRIVKART